MTTEWSCPDSGINYEIEFSPALGINPMERSVPLVEDIEKMTAETGEIVNLEDGMNLAWFKSHSESIYQACDAALANAEYDRGFDETL